MDWSLQQTYYFVASLAGVIATCLNVVLYFRSRPDRLKTKVAEAVKPLEGRVLALEQDIAEAKVERKQAGEKHDTNLRALDHELNGRLRELGAKFDSQYRENSAQLTEQSRAMTRIAAQLEHGVTRHDINTLHHRVTEMAKEVSENSGVVAGLNTTVHNIEDFLREKSRA